MNVLSFKENWLEWVQLLVLLSLTPVFLFPSRRTLWFILLIPILFVLKIWIKKSLFPRTLLDWPLFLLLFQIFVSCLLVPDLFFSLPKISGVLLGILLYYSLTAVLIDVDSIRLGTVMFLSGGTVFSIIGLLGIKWDYDSLLFTIARLLGIEMDKFIFYEKVLPALDSVIPRLKWTLPGAEQGFNANAIGGIIILILPLCLILIFSYFRRKDSAVRIVSSRFFGGALLLFLIVLTSVLFLTFSVTSWIALLAALWIVFVSKKGKAGTVFVLVAAVCLILFVFPSKTSKLWETVSTDLDPEKINFRLKWWSIAVETIKDNPLFGVGMNRMRLHPEIGYEKSHVHNHFLNTAAELGIPGLLAYLALVTGSLYMCVKVFQNSGILWMKSAALGLGCGQIAHFLFGFIDAIPLGAKVGIFFWISLSMITALYKYTYTVKNKDFKNTAQI